MEKEFKHHPIEFMPKELTKSQLLAAIKELNISYKNNMTSPYQCSLFSKAILNKIKDLMECL